LQRILWGAAPITVPLLQRAMATFPAVEFIHAYGMTETAASVSVLRLSHTPEFLGSERIRSAGQAGLSAEIRIADEQGQEVPRGTPGEIWIRGPMVMQGYWGRPQETQQAVRDGWLRTGDGGTMDQDGYLYVIDRIKDMVITGGENVYPAEVENVLCSHPAVQACAVIGVPHEKWGEAVHAVVVLRTGAQATAADLDAHCRSQIGAYKCPKSFEFRDQLPMTAAGKVQKTALRKSVAGQPQP
jgi:long-chain acyl-CoA synthetase